MDFAKNLRIVSYSEKYLSGCLCVDRVDGRADIGRTNGQVSHKCDELIAKQAARTKEQAATAKNYNARSRDSKVAYVRSVLYT